MSTPPDNPPPPIPPVPAPGHEDRPETISGNDGRGLALFLIYFAFYLAFLLANVLAPQAMALTAIPISQERELSLGGLNLAVVWGIGVIFAAIALSLVYMREMRRP